MAARRLARGDGGEPDLPLGPLSSAVVSGTLTRTLVEAEAVRPSASVTVMRIVRLNEVPG